MSKSVGLAWYWRLANIARRLVRYVTGTEVTIYRNRDGSGIGAVFAQPQDDFDIDKDRITSSAMTPAELITEGPDGRTVSYAIHCSDDMLTLVWFCKNCKGGRNLEASTKYGLDAVLNRSRWDIDKQLCPRCLAKE